MSEPTPEKCPKCGVVNLRFVDRNARQFNCGSVFRNGTVVIQTAICTAKERDQLAAKLSAIESAYAECAECAEQREHDLKRRLEDIKKQRDALQAVVTDPHALWSNWLRGDIQLPAGIGDIRECSEKMKRFRSRWLAAHQELRKAEDRIEQLESMTNNTTP